MRFSGAFADLAEPRAFADLMVIAKPNADILGSGAVTVRGLAPELKARLRIRAAHNARSMEAEARAILEAALAGPEAGTEDLANFARGLFAPLGGVDLELPLREPGGDPPHFGKREQPAPRD